MQRILGIRVNPISLSRQSSTVRLSKDKVGNPKKSSNFLQTLFERNGPQEDKRSGLKEKYSGLMNRSRTRNEPRRRNEGSFEDKKQGRTQSERKQHSKKEPAKQKLGKQAISRLALQASKTSDASTRLQLGQKVFENLSKTRNHSEDIQSNLQSYPDLALAYVNYFLQTATKTPEIFIPIIIKSFKTHPEQCLQTMETLIKSLTNLSLVPSQTIGFFETLLLNSNNETNTMKMIGFLKKLAQFTKTADPLLKEYITKWAALATIDRLETALTAEQHRFVGVYEFDNVNSAHKNVGKITKALPDVRGGDLLAIKRIDTRKTTDLDSFRRPDFRLLENHPAKSIDIHSASLFENQSNRGSPGKSTILDLLAEKEQPQESFFGVVQSAGLRDCLINCGNNVIEPGVRYEIKKVDTLNSYRAEMEALSIIGQKGDQCTGAYAHLMGNNAFTKKNSIRLLRNKDWTDMLNESQMKAIESVIEQPVSLIQGPPGTGKTHTLAKLIKVLTRRHGPGSVLVCTPTNAACDNVVQYSAQEGLRVIRLGDKSSIRDDLMQYTVDHQVPDPIRNFPDAMRVIRRADVVCTTCASAGGALLKSMKFKYVIIDEASQLTETIALIPIVRNSSSVILVGDHKQLPPSVGFWAKNAGYDESLFQRLTHRVKPMLLDTQYRSHPLIMDFPSLKFYENGLKNGTPKHLRKAPAGFNWNTDKNGESLPVAFVNSFHREDRECGLSKSNTGEAKIIIDILVGFFKKGVKPNEIGIISPYAGQNKTIKKLLQKLNLDVELNSVDAFQGREKEIILFSATRSNLQGGIGFLSDPRRFNVMHTRAKKGLVVVGNRETLERDKTWKHWLEWIDENRLEVKVKH